MMKNHNVIKIHELKVDSNGQIDSLEELAYWMRIKDYEINDEDYQLVIPINNSKLAISQINDKFINKIKMENQTGEADFVTTEFLKLLNEHKCDFIFDTQYGLSFNKVCSFIKSSLKEYQRFDKIKRFGNDCKFIVGIRWIAYKSMSCEAVTVEVSDGFDIPDMFIVNKIFLHKIISNHSNLIK